ncbi:MAG: hypothetical protein WDW38_007277 [Sanguina aurantia]
MRALRAAEDGTPIRILGIRGLGTGVVTGFGWFGGSKAGRATEWEVPSHLLALPELRSPDTVRWRYPPQEFVEVRRKGLRGGWVAHPD